MTRGSFHLISSTDRRGAETFAVDLVRVLEHTGTPGTLAALAPGRGKSPLAVPVLGSTRWSLEGFREVRRRCTRASVAVGHGSDTLLALAVGGVGTRTPFVYRNIGDPLEWAGTRARRTRVSLFLRRARVVVTLWPASAETLSEHFGVPAGRIVVIPNGCDSARFPEVSLASRIEARRKVEVSDDRHVAVCIGALSPEKAVDTAICAVGRLPDWNLLVIGDGSEEHALRALAEAIAPGRIRFVPALEDLASVLAAADIVVLPSRTEGMPAVAIEAGMSGLPVVASSVGGIPEIVVDGVTGILVPPGEPDSFARAIEVAYSNRVEMGSAARRHCLDRFEMGVVASAWADLLNSLA
jgi:glycosyltransferase involved in cell wall biosynthesis